MPNMVACYATTVEMRSVLPSHLGKGWPFSQVLAIVVSRSLGRCAAPELVVGQDRSLVAPGRWVAAPRGVWARCCVYSHEAAARKFGPILGGRIFLKSSKTLLYIVQDVHPTRFARGLKLLRLHRALKIGKIVFPNRSGSDRRAKAQALPHWMPSSTSASPSLFLLACLRLPNASGS